MIRCAMCHEPVTDEAAPVLTYGAAGQARVLCPACDCLLSRALESTDAADVRDALHALTDVRLTHGDLDRHTAEVLNELTARATERLRTIEDGTLSVTEDADVEDADVEDAADAPVDVPEELCESEEDRALDRADEERERVYNGYMKYVYIGCLVATVAYFVYFFFFR